MRACILFILTLLISSCSPKEEAQEGESTQSGCIVNLVYRLEPTQPVQGLPLIQNKPGLGIFETDSCDFEIRVRLQYDLDKITACEWNIKHENKGELEKLHHSLTMYFNEKTDTDKQVSEYGVWVYRINNRRHEISLINNLPEDASLSLYIWPR